MKKKLIGFALMKKEDPERFYKLQKERAKKGGIAVHLKHPNLGKNLGQWVKDHPEHSRKTAIATHKKHPNLRYKLGKITTKKHPNLARERGLKVQKLYPNLSRNTAKKTLQKYPNLTKEMGLISAEKNPRNTKQEMIMRKLLPEDFIYNKRLGIGVPDFHSPERKIVIEVDGNWHYTIKNQERDQHQEKVWKQMGYQIFRFGNKDVDKYMAIL